MSSESDAFAIYRNVRDRALGISDATKPPAGLVFSFLPTGLPINKLDFENPYTPDSPTGSIQSLANLLSLVDRKLVLNERAQAVPGSTPISDTWKVILDSAMAVPVAPVSNPTVKAALEAANKLLTTPEGDMSKAYANYRTYKKDYFTEIQNYAAAYQTAYSTEAGKAAWPSVGKKFKNDVDTAWDDWNVLGKRQQIESALDLIKAQGTDAATAIIAASKKKFEEYQVAYGALATTIPYVHVLPSNWWDPDGKGWTEYFFDSKHTTTTTSAESSSWSANANVTAGFWGFGASGSHAQGQSFSNFSSDELYIRFRYAIVNIDRPWLNTVLLNLNNWYISGCPKGSVSSGKSSQTKPDETEPFWLPALPSQMLVLKNLYIRTKDTKSAYAALSSYSSGGGSVGWGPFTIGGSSSSSNSSSSGSFELKDEGIYVHGVQLMGWISELLPFSPSMDTPKDIGV
jgi:hypothetical protein